MKQLAIITLLSLYSLYAFAGNIAREGAYVFDSQKKYLDLFRSQGLIIDQMGQHGYEVYGPAGIKNWIQDQLHLQFIDLDNEFDNKTLVNYPTYLEMQERLKELEERFPEILTLFSIGKSVNGRELWVMKISDNPQIDEIEPEFKYIANMHGNEIAGREHMVQLIEDLANNYMNGDERIVNLVNNSEIFIMPTMNPDGAEQRRRGNANWTDLNRDFPDFTSDNNNTPANRATETKAVMQFQASRHFSLSANFHAGAVCVNYPWDTTKERHPFDQLVQNLSREYASLIPEMKNSYEFQDGITNGYDWYQVDGGMQDWSYYWHNDLQITVEQTSNKWPSYDFTMEAYRKNKESLIRFISRLHQGAGVVLPSDENASLTIVDKISGKNLGNYGFKKEFYKVLMPGEYSFDIVTKNGEKYQKDVHVDNENNIENGNYVRI